MMRDQLSMLGVGNMLIYSVRWYKLRVKYTFNTMVAICLTYVVVLDLCGQIY